MLTSPFEQLGGREHLDVLAVLHHVPVVGQRHLPHAPLLGRAAELGLGALVAAAHEDRLVAVAHPLSLPVVERARISAASGRRNHEGLGLDAGRSTARLL